jgi:hypothetical protein
MMESVNEPDATRRWAVRFRPGMRVRYKYADKDTGTIVRACRHGRGGIKSGDWLVRWDHDPHGPGLIPAFEDNMELIEDGPK